MSEMNEFYNKFTYPFTTVKQKHQMNGESIFLFYDYESDADGFAKKDFLDAGCGTGQRVIEMAKAFPNANFKGIDFSVNSIEIAQNQALSDVTQNIQFEVTDINKYYSDHMYDFITSIGVIHHLPDPKKTIRHLSQFLKQNGLMVIWVYHTFGEYDRMLQRKVLRTLLTNVQDQQIGVDIMQELSFSISNNRYGKSYGDDLSFEDQISKNADAFLNPLVRTYTMTDILELFSDSGLDWISLNHVNVNDNGYFISLEEQKSAPPWLLNQRQLLKSDKAYKLFTQLDKLKQFEVIESLIKPTGMTIFAGKMESLFELPDRIRENALFLTD